MRACNWLNINYCAKNKFDDVWFVENDWLINVKAKASLSEGATNSSNICLRNLLDLDCLLSAQQSNKLKAPNKY